MKITIPNIELKVIELEKRVKAQTVLTSMQQQTIDILIKTQSNLMANLSQALASLDMRVTDIEDDIYIDEEEWNK